MNFLDFDSGDLYFDEAMSAENEAMLNRASEAYPEKESEDMLLKLQSLLPDSLTVTVALYRYYYYQHRYLDALNIATRAMEISAAQIGLRVGWERVTEQILSQGVFVSMGLIRFYMLGLKASAYLLLRTNQIEEAYARLKKITELDPVNQFGAAFLLKIAEREMSVKIAEQHARRKKSVS